MVCAVSALVVFIAMRNMLSFDDFGDNVILKNASRMSMQHKMGVHWVLLMTVAMFCSKLGAFNSFWLSDPLGSKTRRDLVVP